MSVAEENVSFCVDREGVAGLSGGGREGWGEEEQEVSGGEKAH